MLIEWFLVQKRIRWPNVNCKSNKREIKISNRLRKRLNKTKLNSNTCTIVLNRIIKVKIILGVVN
jgi:chorismate mutase